MQGFVAFVQRPDGVFLSFVLDEAVLFDGLLPGAEGGVDSHGRQYAIAHQHKCNTVPVVPLSAPVVGCVTKRLDGIYYTHNI
jgi:hypothetical protein